MARNARLAKEITTQVLLGTQPVSGVGKRFSLTIAQRGLLADNRLMEDAVALFLDPEVDRTNRQIADALGLSPDQLKRLMQTESFRDFYEAQLVDIGHSPRLKGVRASIDEMLPMAARVVRNIMTDPDVPPGVRLKAAQHVLEYAPKDTGGGDQIKEFTAFLATFSTKADKITVSVPDSYSEAMKRFADPDVIDGEAKELSPVPTAPF